MRADALTVGLVAIPQVAAFEDRVLIVTRPTAPSPNLIAVSTTGQSMGNPLVSLVGME